MVLSVLKRLPKGKFWEKQSVPGSFPCSLDMFHYLQDSRIFNKQKISQQCLTDATSTWGTHVPAVFLKELVCLGLIECQKRKIIFKTPRTKITLHVTLLQSTLRSSRVPWVKKNDILWTEPWRCTNSTVTSVRGNFTFYLLFGSSVMYTHLE